MVSKLKKGKLCTLCLIKDEAGEPHTWCENVQYKKTENGEDIFSGEEDEIIKVKGRTDSRGNYVANIIEGWQF